MPSTTSFKISSNQEANDNTHSQQAVSLKTEIEKITQKINQRGNLPHISVKEQLEILEQLAAFPLGRFFIREKRLDGYWTDYVVNHPQTGRLTGLNSNGEPFTELESYILNRAPVFLATQERFSIFQREIQQAIREKSCQQMTLASIPCGLMSDLLMLDYSQLSDYQLFGVDHDEEMGSRVKNSIRDKNLEERVLIIQEDAWQVTLPQKADLLTSNGLNLYVPDDNRVRELYKNFFDNLKDGGILVTSFLTPPPSMTDCSEWKLSEIDSHDAHLQRVVFQDVLAVSWQSYRSTEMTEQQLRQSGFTEIRILEDRARMFPTVVAKR